MGKVEDKLKDRELMEKFINGDESAFKELVRRYKTPLYIFLRRFLNTHDLIEDVFQETFLQLYNSKESFDTSRPLKPWLFTIAANKAKDALRKRKRTSALPIGTITEPNEMSFNDVLNSMTSEDETPFNELDKSETAQKVRDVVAKMPDNLRQILILAYFNKFSYKQMAEILSIPIGTVKSRLHTAVGTFAKMWKSSVGEKGE